MSSHKYLLVLDSEFFIQKIEEKATCPNQVRIEEELWDRNISEVQSNLNIGELSIRNIEYQRSTFIGGYFVIRVIIRGK